MALQFEEHFKLNQLFEPNLKGEHEVGNTVPFFSYTDFTLISATSHMSAIYIGMTDLSVSVQPCLEVSVASTVHGLLKHNLYPWAVMRHSLSTSTFLTLGHQAALQGRVSIVPCEWQNPGSYGASPSEVKMFS